jgi:hypothetical protein
VKSSFLLIFKRSAELEAFAQSLATDIIKSYPPALDTAPDKRPSQNRLTRILEDACKKTAEFQKSAKLGWIGKARLANAFKWRLKESGYSAAFVDLATEAVVVHLSKKS